MQVAQILKSALGGNDISAADAEILFGTQGDQAEAVFDCADKIRKECIGDAVTYVINRNINFTNVCYMGCTFCAFSKRRENDTSELLPISEIVRRAREAYDRGATEVCIQGGLHPDIPGNHYLEIVSALKSEIPDIHIHAFSPFEIWYGAKKSRVSYKHISVSIS